MAFLSKCLALIAVLSFANASPNPLGLLVPRGNNTKDPVDPSIKPPSVSRLQQPAKDSVYIVAFEDGKKYVPNPLLPKPTIRLKERG